MLPYMVVSLAMGETERGIICEGPQGSAGLAALYNMSIIQFTRKIRDLGPVDETYVTSRIALTLHDSLETDTVANQVDAKLRVGAFNVIKEYQTRLAVYPILAGPQDFEITDSVYLFAFLGIRLLHGWVLDPVVSLYDSIQDYTYDELIQYRDSLEGQTENMAVVQRLLTAADNQLTDFGFNSLFQEIEENEYAVVFCYNRFNVVHKHDGKLFILETSVEARHQFPGVVWRLFDGGSLEDSILLTGEFVLLEGQPNFDEKVTRWTRESNETSSPTENLSRNQKRKAQRKRARVKKKEDPNASSAGAQSSAGDFTNEDSKKELGGARDVLIDGSENEAGQGIKKSESVQPAAGTEDNKVAAEFTKDDSKKKDCQDTKKKENKPSGSAKFEITSKENQKGHANMSLESLEPKETDIGPPREIDYSHAAPAQSTDVSKFLNFLLEYKHDGHDSYFRGILDAFKGTHQPWFFVPYEFILQFDELLALKIQDNYPSIYEDLKEAVVLYFQRYQVTYPDVHLKILGLPKPKSVQTFEDYVSSIVLLEVYDVYGDGLDESPSYDGRKMALGYLHCILDKFKTGKCFGGQWDEANMRVKNGSEFVIHCETDMQLTPDSGILDLLNFSRVVLQRFKNADGKLPPYFEEFDIDCFLFPDPEDQVKWERFLELIGSPFGLKHPLVRSGLLCNTYLVADANCSGDPPRYMPFFINRKDCQDWRPAARRHPLFSKVFNHQQSPRPRVLKTRYLLDPWGITHWSVVKYSRHFIQQVLRHTKGHDLTQQIEDIAVVDILLSRRLGKYIAKFVRFLVLECGVHGLFSSPWRHFVASDCTDKPQGYTGLKNASAIDELLTSVSEEMVAVAYSEVGVPSVAVELHKSTFICDADLEDFSSVLNKNGIMCQVIDENRIEVNCQVTLDGVQQHIEVSRHSPAEGTSSSPSVIGVQGPYCEEYQRVFELLGVWLGL